MHEKTARVTLGPSGKDVAGAVASVASLAAVPKNAPEINRFAGRTLNPPVSFVLVTVSLRGDGSASVCVNTDKVTLGSVLLNDLKAALAR